MVNFAIGAARRMMAAGGAAGRFLRDRRGYGAVEFAMLTPILFMTYFLTMEIAQAIETSKKVSRIGSMVADLVTQQSTISKSEADAILKIGEGLLQPYNRSRPTIAITAIQMSTDATPKPVVVWSRKLADGAYSTGQTKGSLTTVPDKLRVAGSFLIRVQSQLGYVPVVAFSAGQESTLGLAAAFDKLDMGDAYYLRPRMSDTVPCADC